MFLTDLSGAYWQFNFWWTCPCSTSFPVSVTTQHCYTPLHFSEFMYLPKHGLTTWPCQASQTTSTAWVSPWLETTHLSSYYSFHLIFISSDQSGSLPVLMVSILPICYCHRARYSTRCSVILGSSSHRFGTIETVWSLHLSYQMSPHVHLSYFQYVAWFYLCFIRLVWPHFYPLISSTTNLVFTCGYALAVLTMSARRCLPLPDC